MRYRKINDATVQCIISNADMEEYGLTLSDIFERNEKGEDFLRNVIERANEEVGYEVNGHNIAMQITPLKDKGIVITFSDETAGGFQDMLQHLKEILVGKAANDMKDALQELEHIVEEDNERHKEANDVNQQRADIDDTIRIFCFDEMTDLLEYCNAIYGEKQLHSKLYKDKDIYYLIVDKNRLSWDNFNKISAQVMEFGALYPFTKSKMNYLEEHGECLIDKQAIGKLKKVCK